MICSLQNSNLQQANDHTHSLLQDRTYKRSLLQPCLLMPSHGSLHVSQTKALMRLTLGALQRDMSAVDNGLRQPNVCYLGSETVTKQHISSLYVAAARQLPSAPDLPGWCTKPSHCSCTAAPFGR